MNSKSIAAAFPKVNNFVALFIIYRIATNGAIGYKMIFREEISQKKRIKFFRPTLRF